MPDGTPRGVGPEIQNLKQNTAEAQKKEIPPLSRGRKLIEKLKAPLKRLWESPTDKTSVVSGAVNSGRDNTQPIQEAADPVKEYAIAAENWFNLFYRLGAATDRRVVNGVERSLATRVERASLLKDLKAGKVTRAEVDAIRHDLDDFDREYLNQGRLSVDMAELGVQQSQYIAVELPSKREAATEKPPIFLIPALSGDLNGVRPLVREAALQGRRVITAGYPESFMGQVTDAFAKASLESVNFEPHSSYFKKAIQTLVGEGDFELWGYSAGGGLAAELLNDPELQQRVTNAVIIAPAGSIEQSKADVVKGVLHEFKEVLKNPRNIYDTVVTYARNGPMEAEHKKLRDKIFFSALFNKVGKRINAWEGMRVQEGGKIIIATGRKDEITKSYRIMDGSLNSSANSQFRLLDDSQASHLSFLTEASSLVSHIASIRDNPQAPQITRI